MQGILMKKRQLYLTLILVFFYSKIILTKTMKKGTII